MWIELKRWDEIKHIFTNEERDEMQAVVNGTMICPPKVQVDESKLSERLVTKLRKAIAGEKGTF